MGIGEGVTLEELELDPHPVLARMLADEPVCFVPSTGLWFVTTWDDVVQVCEQPDRFRSQTEPSWLRDVLGENMLTLDGERHDRLATAMKPPFVASSALPVVRDGLADLFDGIIDTFVADGRADLMTRFAEPMANLALAEALGFREIGWQELAGWCRGVCTGLANFANDPERAAIAATAHRELAVALDRELALVAEHGLAGQGGLAHFVAAGLGRDEIVNNVRLMISGGINEPRDGVGLVMFELLTRPDLLARVRHDRARLRKVIEETFRFHSPVGTATRQTTADVEIGGVTIAAGEMVAGVITAANRDPRRWSEPDRFDPDRSEGAHLAFSVGEHRCLGEWLGRQQVRVGVERLLDRLPGLELDGNVELRGFEFRGPTSLPVRWTA